MTFDDALYSIVHLDAYVADFIKGPREIFGSYGVAASEYPNIMAYAVGSRCYRFYSPVLNEFLYPTEQHIRSMRASNYNWRLVEIPSSMRNAITVYMLHYS